MYVCRALLESIFRSTLLEVEGHKNVFSTFVETMRSSEERENMKKKEKLELLSHSRILNDSLWKLKTENAVQVNFLNAKICALKVRTLFKRKF